MVWTINGSTIRTNGRTRCGTTSSSNRNTGGLEVGDIAYFVRLRYLHFVIIVLVFCFVPSMVDTFSIHICRRAQSGGGTIRTYMSNLEHRKFVPSLPYPQTNFYYYILLIRDVFFCALKTEFVI